MKQKIRSLIISFIGNRNPIEKEIPIQDLSVFFSILLATFTLHIKKNRPIKRKASFEAYHQQFANELVLINSRYPELVATYDRVESCLRKELLVEVFEKLNTIFDSIDDDIDDTISWSYQFLKRDLEKSAFKKVKTSKSKIQGTDLLFTTQFFTDKYMVKYLVNNVLQRLTPDQIESVKVIDPASGGGNFLTYAFEVLYKRYEHIYPGKTKTELVDHILSKILVGYDLDGSLSNIASLSLFVKACSYAIPSKSTPIKIYGGLDSDKLGFLSPNPTSTPIEGRFITDELSNQEVLKVFITNPPFMGKRDMDISLKKTLQELYPESKGDLCVSFIHRITQLMGKNDILAVVAQNNWMYLSSLKAFRKLILENKFVQECIDLGASAFEDINGEKTNVALCIIGGAPRKTSNFYNLKYLSPSGKRELINGNNVLTELRFEVDQMLFLKNSNYELNYQLAGKFQHLQKLPYYSQFANPMQGTSTGDNTKFVKLAWEVNGNPDWKLVSKGGGFSKWAGLNYYKVLWGKNGELIKANKGSALRNIERISCTQLVYSDTGTLGLNVRVLNDGQIFIASGPGIQVLEGSMFAHLAFLNSRIATFLIKLINPKFTVSAGYIGKLPVSEVILKSTSITERSKQCYGMKQFYLKKKLPNYEFAHQDYATILDAEVYAERAIVEDLENDFNRLLLEDEIESEIRDSYKLSSTELGEVTSVVGKSPFAKQNRFTRTAVEDLDYLLSSSIDINCSAVSRAINGFKVGSESVIELISYKLDIHPEEALRLLKSNVSLLHVTKSKYMKDLLHKVTLKELGIEGISHFTYQQKHRLSFIDELISKYRFLENLPNIVNDLHHIIDVHHKISFFNKPLVSVNNEYLTVGIPQNA